MAAEIVKNYLELNCKYLTEGEGLLAKVDSVQASEKLWGASAEIVKAVAAYRGLELKTHGDLWAFGTKLSSELRPRNTQILRCGILSTPKLLRKRHDN